MTSDSDIFDNSDLGVFDKAGLDEPPSNEPRSVRQTHPEAPASLDDAPPIAPGSHQFATSGFRDRRSAVSCVAIFRGGDDHIQDHRSAAHGAGNRRTKYRIAAASTSLRSKSVDIQFRRTTCHFSASERRDLRSDQPHELDWSLSPPPAADRSHLKWPLTLIAILIAAPILFYFSVEGWSPASDPRDLSRSRTDSMT
jgi:hypothetical protein